MSDIGIIAFGAISAFGEGPAAATAGAIGAPARVAIAHDRELARAGLVRPFAARVATVGGSDDRATKLLERALRACSSDLDRVRPGWRRERVGLILGTSSGGMRSAEKAFAAMARGEPIRDVEAPTYFGPMARALREIHVAFDPAMLVLGACASSTIAIGLAVRWLERDGCDVALAGGFDEVTVFVAAGFEALRATTGSPPPRPFRIGRDGMALGEGAAVLALARRAVEARVFVTGFGAASDAVHITAPDREGRGLARAATAALDNAGRPDIDLVSAHATATPFNDPAEASALVAALGEKAARSVVVHPFKAQIGHALGAAGALELLACVDAIDRGVLPAAAGSGIVDPDAAVRLLDTAAAGAPRAVLKLASAFGGANAALVVSRRCPLPARGLRAAFVGAAVHVEEEPPIEELARWLGSTADRVARADPLARLALSAVARLRQRCGPLAAAGIVVGTALATIETNAVFAARIRERGAHSAEPRPFPYTSPNAAPGECSIAFGLTGPSFSVGGGMHAALEALAAGALLVEAADAERIVVVAVDCVGPATRALAGNALRSGAVALLLSASGAGARARVGTVTLRRGVPSSGGPFALGHRALLPLVGDEIPASLSSGTPPDAFAHAILHRV